MSTTLILLMMILSLLTIQFSSVNTKPVIRMKETYIDVTDFDAIDVDVSKEGVKYEIYPFDPGKTSDTTNYFKEAETIDEDAGKTTPRVLLKDCDVIECSGSKSLIQDDLLFQ